MLENLARINKNLGNRAALAEIIEPKLRRERVEDRVPKQILEHWCEKKGINPGRFLEGCSSPDQVSTKLGLVIHDFKPKGKQGDASDVFERTYEHGGNPVRITVHVAEDGKCSIVEARYVKDPSVVIPPEKVQHWEKGITVSDELPR